MTLGSWIDAFRHLNEKARSGTLDASELPLYCSAREEMTRAMRSAQQLCLKPGQVPREALRVRRALPLTLQRHGSEPLKTVTIELSTNGFSVLLEESCQTGEILRFSLRLAKNHTIDHEARVVNTTAETFHHHVCFEFLPLEDAKREQVMHAVLETVLDHIEHDLEQRRRAARNSVTRYPA